MMAARLALAILAISTVLLMVVWLTTYVVGGTSFDTFIPALWYVPIAFFLGLGYSIVRASTERDDIWDSLRERGLRRLESGSTIVQPPFLTGGVRVRGKLLGPHTLAADNEGIIFLALGKARSRIDWSAISVFEIHSKEGGGCFARAMFGNVGPRGTQEIDILWDERLTPLVPGDIRRRVRPEA